MTNMAAMSINGKNLKKSSSPEPIDRWPWNLVCSIVYGTEVHMKAWGGIGMKIYTNELGHMTNMAAMPIYGKNLKNFLLQNQ